MKPDFDQFLRAAEEANVVPVYDFVMADLLTPVSAFLKMRGHHRNCCLLESVEGGEKIARYSFLAFDPIVRIETKNGSTVVRRGPESAAQHAAGDFWRLLEEEFSRYRTFHSPDLPPFTGGGVGFFSYDVVRTLERIPAHPHDDLRLPDASIALFPTVLAFDHLKHRIVIIENVFTSQKSKQQLRDLYDRAAVRAETVKQQLLEPLGPEEHLEFNQPDPLPLESNTTREKFIESVGRAKEHIAQGDIFQVVLSQRFHTHFNGDTFDIYRSLRFVNPSPYMFYLDFDDIHVVGASPEMLVKVQDRRLEYRPIAGTRRRGRDDEDDRRLEEELKNDEKERAEHVMLVDLGRNDLGRVSEFGSVKVEDLMFVEKYSHVMHLVSSLSGILRPDMTRFDAFRACFPAGTVTGAPKIRAMEIINQFEPTQRGIYAGSIAYLDFSRNLDSCIALRTIVIQGENIYVQAGAGIVADSNPESEYQECLSKARALWKAIELVHSRQPTSTSSVGAP
ncbi:MAG TPA: anthranilate synthase component I [Acidobacteriota bacterium]|jgi:anthranilate synthase component 1